MKRLFDVVFAGIALALLAPIIVAIALLTWLQDLHSPLYSGWRVGRGGRVFRMAKLRTMIVGADATGILSTAADDRRLTPLGRLVRRFKLDELPQLWNVIVGDMSVVGPRPQVSKEVALYSAEESGLLTVRPGLTDYSSVIFSDLAVILHGSADANLDYRLLVRPWKSRLGLHYVRSRSLAVDIALIGLTALCLLSRRPALAGVRWLLRRTGASPDLIRIADRATPLVPTLPPGVTEAEWRRHLTYT